MVTSTFNHAVQITIASKIIVDALTSETAHPDIHEDGDEPCEPSYSPGHQVVCTTPTAVFH